MFSPGAYIFHTQRHLPYLRDTLNPLISCRVPLVHPRPEPLRAQRSGEQASGTQRLASRHLLGCCGQSGFWGASSATAHRRDRLLPLRRIEIDTTASSSSSWWTFVGLHCEHLPASTVVRYFTQRTMSTSANGAVGAFGTGLSSGYNLKRLFFVFSMSAVVAVVFAMFISNLSSDKIAHVYIYATTILCVIFWIKSNIKMSKFLTKYALCVRNENSRVLY